MNIATISTGSARTSRETQTHHHCWRLFNPWNATLLADNLDVPSMIHVAFGEEFSVHFNDYYVTAASAGVSVREVSVLTSS